jgi:hypothetical protein
MRKPRTGMYIHAQASGLDVISPTLIAEFCKVLYLVCDGTVEPARNCACMGRRLQGIGQIGRGALSILLENA